ncbi:hypothetical protein CDV50_03260 [Haematobacter massiliensis]|uniref:hypothetical protein n=1 Tax=Haematobacter massiliensis TaxID=195105 RepID=UPI000B49F739|nr:hypothetical protein [Haematobacter massiliensis]OWJ73312.1 hypothetical protein CDV50_03260 [Haematobacter massiliensis]
MGEAPDRIWAIYARTSTIYMSGNTPVMAQDGPFSHYRDGKASEYLSLTGPTLNAVREALDVALQTITAHRDELLRDFCTIGSNMDRSTMDEGETAWVAEWDRAEAYVKSALDKLGDG